MALQLGLFSILRRLTRRARKPVVRTRAATHRVRTVRTAPLSDPSLHQLWCQVRAEYFPGRAEIDEYRVIWSSRRQRRTLASCHMKKRRVNVAKELRDATCQHWLEPILYHEMCHAVLGTDPGYYRGKRAWHGPEFRKLEHLHPQIRALDEWIKIGGWAQAVRRDRAKQAATTRISRQR